VTVTWNPADKVNVTLSSGNLTATVPGNGTVGGVRATLAHGTGKWYLEFSGILIGSAYFLGFMTAATSLDSGPFAPGGFSIGQGSTNVPTTGDTLSVAIDIDTGRYWTRQNGGTWFGASGFPSPDPVTETGGASTARKIRAAGQIMFPFLRALDGSVAETCTVQAEPGGFTYTPPAGFNAWDSVPPPNTKRSYATVMS
jgi:hypothetical protein